MCRSIKVLRNPESPATDAEIEAAALQFVRKISGYRQPSQANADAFDDAVADVAEASRRCCRSLRCAAHAEGTALQSVAGPLCSKTVAAFPGLAHSHVLGAQALGRVRCSAADQVDVSVSVGPDLVAARRRPVGQHTALAVAHGQQVLRGLAALPLRQVEQPVLADVQVRGELHVGPLGYELSLGVENLDAVVLAVADVNQALVSTQRQWGEKNAPGPSPPGRPQDAMNCPSAAKRCTRQLR